MKKISIVFFLGLALIFIPFVSSINFEESDYTNTNIVNIVNGSEILHNNLSDLQGGVATEYYHIRESWFNELTSDIFNWITQAEGDALYYDLGNSYSYYNSTTLQDLNSTGLIINWSTGEMGYVTNSVLASYNYYNSTDFVITDYYLNSNPFSYYNSTNPSPVINESYYLKSNPSNYWNDTFATFNETYADTIYAPIGSAGNPFDQSLNTTENVTFANVTATTYFGDGSQLTGISASGGDITGNGTTNYLPRYFNASYLTDSIIYDDGTGNVGIGTTSPDAKLDVNGIINAGSFAIAGEIRSVQGNGYDNYVSLKSEYGGVGSINKAGLFRSNTNYFVYYDTHTGDTVLDSTFASGDIIFSHQGAQQMRIDASGNVGIGTTTPQKTLHVAGDGLFNGTLTIAKGTASGHAVTLGQLQSSVGSVTEVDPYWSSNFTNGLSGNWNVGAFDITANNFIGAWNGSSDYYLKNNPFRFYNSTNPSPDTTYSAGNGISLSTTTFSVAGNTALTQDTDGLSVTNNAIGDTQLEYNTGQHLTSTSNPTFNNQTITDCIVFSSGGQICSA